MKVNHKKQQETINLKEPINNLTTIMNNQWMMNY